MQSAKKERNGDDDDVIDKNIIKDGEISCNLQRKIETAIMMILDKNINRKMVRFLAICRERNSNNDDVIDKNINRKMVKFIAGDML